MQELRATSSKRPGEELERQGFCLPQWELRFPAERSAGRIGQRHTKSSTIRGAAARNPVWLLHMPRRERRPTEEPCDSKHRKSHRPARARLRSQAPRRLATRLSAIARSYLRPHTSCHNHRERKRAAAGNLPVPSDRAAQPPAVVVIAVASCFCAWCRGPRTSTTHFAADPGATAQGRKHDRDRDHLAILHPVQGHVSLGGRDHLAVSALPGMGVRRARACTSHEKRLVAPLIVREHGLFSAAWRSHISWCFRRCFA